MKARTILCGVAAFATLMAAMGSPGVAQAPDPKGGTAVSPGGETQIVSLTSGAGVADALESKGHRVTGVDLNPDAVRAMAEGRAPVVKDEAERGAAVLTTQARKADPKFGSSGGGAEVNRPLAGKVRVMSLA